MAEAERSFHVTCVPGRPLMWKRVPTKRKFSFYLPKVDKSNKLLAKEKSILSMGNKSIGEKTINSVVEDSFKAGKENVLDFLNSMGSNKTGSLNVTKCSKTNSKRKKSVLKDVKNTCKKPIPLTSNICKDFETPVLRLPPTVRRLVNVFLPSNEKSIRSSRSSSMKLLSSEISDLSSNEISAALPNEVSGMIALNQSDSRIVEGENYISNKDDKENAPSETDIAVLHVTSKSNEMSAALSNEVSGMVALNQSHPCIIEGKSRIPSKDNKGNVPSETDTVVSHIASNPNDDSLSSNEISAALSNEVSGMVALNQSHPRIVDGENCISNKDDKENVPSETEADIAVLHITSNLNDSSHRVVKSEGESKGKSCKDSSTVKNRDCKLTHEDIPSDAVRVSDTHAESSEHLETSTPFEQKDEKEEPISTINKSVVSASLPLQDSAPDNDFMESSNDHNDKENATNESIILVEQNTDEKILNTPIYNNLSQSKNRSVALRRSNIQSPYARRDTISLTDRDVRYPDILLLSPMLNTSKNSIASNCSNHSYTQKNLDTCDKKDSPEKETGVAQLSQKSTNSDLTLGKDRSARRKINFLRKPTGLVIHRNFTVSRNRSGEDGSAVLCGSRKRYCLSQEVVQRLKKRRKQNLNPVVLPDDRPGFVLAPKNKNKYTRKDRCLPIKGKFPSKVRVLMCRKSALKRKVANITDLEVIFDILNSDYRKEAQTGSDEVEKILKSYQKGVIRDVATLIYDTVDLQSKTKEIKKLYREIERKGKQLGTLIDEQHKIYNEIANGELRVID